MYLIVNKTGYTARSIGLKTLSHYSQDMRTLLICFALVATTIQAATIDIASDLVGESNNKTGTNVFVTPDSVWATAPAGSGWISYANTGEGPGAFSPPNSTGAPTAIFTQSFFLPNAVNTGSITVWADDTAAVFLDGAAVGPPADFTDGAHCANTPIGCLPNDFATISLTGLSEGGHTLTFDVYQTGGGPFGLLYDGSVTSDSGPLSLDTTPEPSTYLLLGGGLIGLSVMLRRRRSA